MREKDFDRSADQCRPISRCITMFDYFHQRFPPPPFFLFNALPRPRPFCPMIKRSLHICGFVVISAKIAMWKGTAPNQKEYHFILVRTKESELKDFPGVNTPLLKYFPGVITPLNYHINFGYVTQITIFILDVSSPKWPYSFYISIINDTQNALKLNFILFESLSSWNNNSLTLPHLTLTLTLTCKPVNLTITLHNWVDWLAEKPSQLA